MIFFFLHKLPHREECNRRVQQKFSDMSIRLGGWLLLAGWVAAACWLAGCCLLAGWLLLDGWLLACWLLRACWLLLSGSWGAERGVGWTGTGVGVLVVFVALRACLFAWMALFA